MKKTVEYLTVGDSAIQESVEGKGILKRLKWLMAKKEVIDTSFSKRAIERITILERENSRLRIALKETVRVLKLNGVLDSQKTYRLDELQRIPSASKWTWF